MDESTLAYKKTISESLGIKLILLLAISTGLFMAFLGLWTIYQALVDSATNSKLGQSVLWIALGGFLSAWSLLYGRSSFGEVTFGISERGVLLPHPMTLTLSKKRNRFVPFEDIRAVYTNEYWAEKVDDPAIMIRLRNGKYIPVPYDNIGEIPSVLKELEPRTKVYRDRDYLSGLEVFPPSASVDIQESDILIVTDQDRIVVPLSNIAAVRRTPFPGLDLRVGSGIGFHSLSPQLLVGIKKLKKGVREGKFQESHLGSDD